MATNDPAESPFALLTQQLQSFGRVLGIHASAIGQARMNGDFKTAKKTATRTNAKKVNKASKIESEKEGAWHSLPKEMRESLLLFALSVAPAVRQAEKKALDKQRLVKKEKQDMLRKRKLIAVQTEYANALTYIDMFHSPAGWKTRKEARTKFNALGSKTAKLDAVKEQIRIRVIGFGWKDLHHPWSKDGYEYTSEELLEYLLTKLIPEQAKSKRGIPAKPTMTLPSRKQTMQLGTKTLDVVDLDAAYKEDKEQAIEEAIGLRDRLENDGKSDRYEKCQPPKPKKIDSSLEGAKIEQLWILTEPDGTKVRQWYQGKVVAVKKRSKVRIKWNSECLRDGDLEITEERFLISKFNKHVEEGWRFNVE
mmetsp:Transcript_26186/g.44648  ORF Transcript_26186/g.44648 Transcript_26186/m.44648 type:complete len:365 (-) Transcript_26186:8-1102(-)